MLPGGGGGAEAQDWHLDMQLTGKVVLSAAALLLVTAAYRLYKSRPARAPLWDRNTNAKAEEEAEGSRQPEVQGAAPGAPRQGLRRRRGSKERGALPGCSWDSRRGSQVLATAASSSDSEAEGAWKPERQGAGEDLSRRCLESGPAPPRRSGQEAGTAAGSPLGIGAVPRGHHDDREGGADPAASSQPVLWPPVQGFGRKESLLQIVENPELQLQLNSFGSPAPSCPNQSAPPSGPEAGRSPESSPAGTSGEPNLQLVAGTNFFHFPLTPGLAPEVHLDLGNCYEVLTLAKRQNLEALKEAAYKVMSDNYLQVLRSPDIYGRLSGAERELVLQRRLRGRKRLVVADMCPQEDSGRLCCYDDEQDVWHLLTHLPPEAVSRGCAICSLFNYVFVVSGCQGSGCQPSNRVFCYNPLTEIWSEVCPLNQARPRCQLVALDGHLYAIGGECLHTVERYDPRLDRWTFAPPLPNDTFALAHTATACAGDIFVTGGTLRYLLLRFSTREQRWQVGPTAGGKDRTAEMVAVSGFLYRFDLNRSLGISVYRCSASARLWYECATYQTPYPDAFQCAVVGNLIYCVGRRRTLLFLADHVSPRSLTMPLQKKEKLENTEKYKKISPINPRRGVRPTLRSVSSTSGSWLALTFA
ncbi:kelch domain-containing protein 7A isoform 5-T5 [Glossophaga mutica]